MPSLTVPARRSVRCSFSPGGRFVPSVHAQGPQEATVSVRGLDLLHWVEVIYPDNSRKGKIEGTIFLEITICTNAFVKLFKKEVGGPPSLVPSTALDVRQRRYKPYAMSGKPVEFDMEACFGTVRGGQQARTFLMVSAPTADSLRSKNL